MAAYAKESFTSIRSYDLLMALDNVIMRMGLPIKVDGEIIIFMEKDN